MGIFDKLKRAAKGHEDKVGEGLDKAADAVDEKTGGKASEQIQSGVDKAKEQLGVESEPAGEQAQGQQQSGQQGGGQGRQDQGGGQGQGQGGQGGQGQGGQGRQGQGGGQGQGGQGRQGQGDPGNN